MLHSSNVHSLVLLPISNHPHISEQVDEKYNKSENPSPGPIKIKMMEMTKEFILLPQCSWGEHLRYKIEVPLWCINPGSIELHDVLMFKGLEEVNLTVQSLKILGTLKEIIEFHLIPSNFNPLILVKRLITVTDVQAYRRHSQTKITFRTI